MDRASSGADSLNGRTGRSLRLVIGAIVANRHITRCDRAQYDRRLV